METTVEFIKPMDIFKGEDWSSYGDDAPMPDCIYDWLRENITDFPGAREHEWCGDDFGVFFSFSDEEDAMAFKLSVPLQRENIE